MGAESQRPPFLAYLTREPIRAILKQDILGHSYVLPLPFITTTLGLYAMGVALGHARRDRFETLVNLFFDRQQPEQELNSVCHDLANLAQTAGAHPQSARADEEAGLAPGVQQCPAQEAEVCRVYPFRTGGKPRRPDAAQGGGCGLGETTPSGLQESAGAWSLWLSRDAARVLAHLSPATSNPATAPNSLHSTISPGNPRIKGQFAGLTRRNEY